MGGTQVLESRQWDEHKFLIGFPSRKALSPILKCEHSCQVVNKTGKNVDQVKKLVFESRRIAVEMFKCWEFHWIV